MRDSGFKTFALALAVGSLSPQAQADILLGAEGEYGRGVLARVDQEMFPTYGGQGHLGLSYSAFSIYGFFEHLDLAYTHKAQRFKGIYSLSGVGIGLSTYFDSRNKDSKLSLWVQVPLSSALILLNEASATVNDQDYSYSTLTTYQGGTAVKVQVGYEYLAVGSERNKRRSRTGDNLYLGFFLGYLRQQFATQTTRVKTNNSVVAPLSPGTEKTAVAVTVATAAFAATYHL